MNEHEKRQCLGLQCEALDRAVEFALEVSQFEIEARRKDDKAKLDATRNCKKQLAKPRGPLFDAEQKEMF